MNSRPKPHIVVVGHLAGAQLFGAERSLLDVLAAVDRRKFELSCVLPGGSDDYLRAVGGHATDVVVFPYGIWDWRRPLRSRATSGFEQVFRRLGANLVHVNTIALRDPLLAARRLGVPSLVHVRELIDRDRDMAWRLGGRPASIVRSVRESSDFILANSEASHALYRKEGRSFRLYNCVNCAHFDLPNEIEAGKLKVGIISNNSPKKGIEYFVKLAIMAAERRPELEFFVIGPINRHVRRLQHMLARRDPPVNLRFQGYVADPRDAIRQLNVVVSFSTVAESFGRTIAEAMAARRPVIAYDWGAAPELIRHAVDGYLVAYRDIAQAFEHLEALAARPNLVIEMGCNGRARAETMFSPAGFASELNEVYDKILQC